MIDNTVFAVTENKMSGWIANGRMFIFLQSPFKYPSFRYDHPQHFEILCGVFLVGYYNFYSRPPPPPLLPLCRPLPIISAAEKYCFNQY